MLYMDSTSFASIQFLAYWFDCSRMDSNFCIHVVLFAHPKPETEFVKFLEYR